MNAATTSSERIRSRSPQRRHVGRRRLQVGAFPCAQGLRNGHLRWSPRRSSRRCCWCALSGVVSSGNHRRRWRPGGGGGGGCWRLVAAPAAVANDGGSGSAAVGAGTDIGGGGGEAPGEAAPSIAPFSSFISKHSHACRPGRALQAGVEKHHSEYRDRSQQLRRQRLSRRQRRLRPLQEHLASRWLVGGFLLGISRHRNDC